MKKRGKVRKGAFELSITTIVILVIAMIMLILGLTLVRKIMCGGMSIATQSLDSAKKQISNLFGEESGEIVCLGTPGKSDVTIVPDRKNYVACTINAEETAKYTLIIKEAEFIDRNGNRKDAIKWFVSTKDERSAIAGESKAIGVPVIPPKGTSNGFLEVVVEIRKEGEQPITETLRYEVRNLGWLRKTAC